MRYVFDKSIKLIISRLFIPGSILFLGMIQNFFPLASELKSGSSFIRTTTCVAQGEHSAAKTVIDCLRNYFFLVG